jgi:uncharacterized protein
MRAVFDAAILVRAHHNAAGPARAARRRVTERPHCLILSPYILAETQRVLSYPRVNAIFGLDSAEIREYIRYLEFAAEIVDPKVTEPVVLKDPNDDPVIYTAVAGKADVLCTLDRHFYDPAVLEFCRMRDIRVMSDVDLLARLNRGES